jgi:hypothetical protein
MPNPPLGSIRHRQGSIIWDPYMPDVKPEDEVKWLWTPLEQELKAVAADFLNPLSAELRSSFVEKKAGTTEEVRTMANAWLKENETPATARRALNLLYLACRCLDIWEPQLLDDKCQLEIKGTQGGTKKITIEPSVVFRMLEQSKRRDRVTIRLLISFPSSSYTTVDATKPVGFYGFIWRVDHDLTLERGSFMQRLGTPRLGPDRSSLWSGRSSRLGYRSLEEFHYDNTGPDQSNLDRLSTEAPTAATSGSSRSSKLTNIV